MILKNNATCAPMAGGPVLTMVLLALGGSGCGTSLSVNFQPSTTQAFAPHRGGVALYRGDEHPRVPCDDVGSIEVISEGKPSSDAMETALRGKARSVGATAVLNVRWYADVREEGQVFREVLQGVGCLSDPTFCLLMDNRPRTMERLVLVGYAVRARR